MTRGETKLHPGGYYAHILWDARPNGLRRRIDRGDLPQEDKDLAKNLLRSRRNRLSTAAALHTPHRALTAREEASVVYFIGLVNAVDDHVDTMNRTPNGRDGRSLAEKLIDLPVRNTDLTVGEMTLKLADTLPDNKVAPVGNFLSDMLRLHEGPKEFKPGSYGFAEAMEYRLKTTVPFVLTAADLVDLDKSRRSDVEHGAIVIQFIDDARDVAEDAGKSYNLFIGMANDDNREELDRVLAAVEDPASTYRSIFNASQPTRQKYLAAYHAEVAKLSKPGRRGLMRAVGKVFM